MDKAIAHLQTINAMFRENFIKNKHTHTPI